MCLNCKRAFTLAETLIVLVIIGFLAIILINASQNMLPDRKKALYKKAYQVTEKNVAELANDESMYPYTADPNQFGFRNTGGATLTGTNEMFGGDSKFCRLFARKLNLIAVPTYNNVNHSCEFETSDGLKWNVGSLFNRDGYTQISVDVNGDDLPNDGDINNPGRDIFYIYVFFDGRVMANVDGTDTLEVQFLKSHSIR